jgi:hypothetical protein
MQGSEVSETDDERERIKEQIRRAFISAKRPPNGSLHGTIEGDEPPLLEADFQDKHDWRALDGAFLDQAPKGYASAFSFFSDDALRYFLPAFLIADLDGQLDRVDVPSRLSSWFTDESRSALVNPRRYGNPTKFEAKTQRFRNLAPEEVAAVVTYLEHAAKHYQFCREPIDEALANYWRPRLRSLTGG